MSLRCPTVAFLLFIFLYKPFMWCRPDTRLRHVFYFLPFEASLQTPDRSSSYFIGISGGLPPDFLSLFPLCKVFNTCVRIHKFRSCASCLHLLYLMSKLFASTFKVLTGLSLAIVLVRFLAWRGAQRRQPRT